jgi:iron(III) transport system substrate-binding protein
MQCLWKLGVTLAFAAGLSSAALAQTKLTIYTALENDQLAPFKADIEKAVPGVQVNWVRDSTGVITARFLAEKSSPKADMVMGLAASSLLLFKTEGLLESYKPAGVDALKAAFRDAKEPYAWTGMDAFLSVVCFNKPEGEKRKAVAPVSWTDLTKPEFKNQVVMPHPASSGTGYLLSEPNDKWRRPIESRDKLRL